MDAFSYNDIFQTKGIEYIIIIAFLILLIPFWIILGKKSPWIVQLQQSVEKLANSVWQVSKGLYYSRNHTWTHLEKSGLAQVGADDWLLQITGKANFVPHQPAGKTIKKGDPLAELEKDGKKLRILSPISGVIKERNEKAFANAGLIYHVSSNKGWLYKIEPTQWKTETQDYHLGNESEQWFKNEMLRFKDFVSIQTAQNSPEVSMLVLQEGGELMANPLAQLPETIWNDFQNEFLNK
jgi:glycine cleavage system H protein